MVVMKYWRERQVVISHRENSWEFVCIDSVKKHIAEPHNLSVYFIISQLTVDEPYHRSFSYLRDEDG